MENQILSRMIASKKKKKKKIGSYIYFLFYRYKLGGHSCFLTRDTIVFSNSYVLRCFSPSTFIVFLRKEKTNSLIFHPTALCLNISSSSIFVEEAPLEGLPLSGLESGISFDRQSLSSLAPSILQRSNTKWIATIYDLNVNSIYFRLLEACL